MKIASSALKSKDIQLERLKNAVQSQHVNRMKHYLQYLLVAGKKYSSEMHYIIQI